MIKRRWSGARPKNAKNPPKNDYSWVVGIGIMIAFIVVAIALAGVPGVLRQAIRLTRVRRAVQAVKPQALAVSPLSV
jgi:hypothetical protein